MMKTLRVLPSVSFLCVECGYGMWVERYRPSLREILVRCVNPACKLYHIWLRVDVKVVSVRAKRGRP